MAVRHTRSTTAINAPNLHIADDSITGVDWDSTNTATVNNVKGITTPLLIMAMTGHYFIVPAEMHYQSAQNSKNKTLVYVEGESHAPTPCTVDLASVGAHPGAHTKRETARGGW